MKSVHIFMATLGLLSTQAFSIPDPCLLSLDAMKAQIAQYGSISTKGCPFNYQGWGITSITDVVQTGSYTCFARCKYAYNTGSSGRDCTWSSDNWGTTLNCSF